VLDAMRQLAAICVVAIELIGFVAHQLASAPAFDRPRRAAAKM
jgi:hypothetical protein